MIPIRCLITTWRLTFQTRIIKFCDNHKKLPVAVKRLHELLTVLLNLCPLDPSGGSDTEESDSAHDTNAVLLGKEIVS